MFGLLFSKKRYIYMQSDSKCLKPPNFIFSTSLQPKRLWIGIVGRLKALMQEKNEETPHSPEGGR